MVTCSWVFPGEGVANLLEHYVIYGASDTKLGTMADYIKKGMSHHQVGKEIRRRIMNDIPALDELTQRVQRDAKKRGWVEALDGRKLYIRGEHSALNTLFQGSGAVVMKVSMLYLDKWCKKEGIEYKKLMDFHDESQAEMFPEFVERYSELAVKSLEQSGTFLKVRCPITGEVNTGSNWAMTH